MPYSGRVAQQQGYLSPVPGGYGVAVFQLDRLGKPGHNAVPLVLIALGHQHRLPIGLLQNVLQGVQLVGVKLMGDTVLVIDSAPGNL